MRVKSQESRVEGRKAEAWHRRTLSSFPLRSGLTLIELLVVILLLTTLVAAAIPILAPSSNERRIREAARGVNTFITGAQMKAVELRRPYGVALKRLSQDTNPDPVGNPIHEDNAVCLELFYVEQPPAFMGFDESSAARLAIYTPSSTSLYGGLRPLVLIQFVTRGNSVLQSTDGLPGGWDADLFPGGVVRPGDVIEINGTQYELLSDLGDSMVTPTFEGEFFAKDTGKAAPLKATQIVARPINDTGQMINVKYDDKGFELGTITAPDPPFFTPPAPYKILRQPMPTSSEPYQLPEGTAIDLRASGIGLNDYFYWPDVHDNSQGVLIMFAPEGRVSRVRFSVDGAPPSTGLPPFDEPVTDNLFLLVGRRENAPAPPVNNDKTLDSIAFAGLTTEDEQREVKEPINWLLGECRWIAIGAQSGRVVTTENAFVEPQAVIQKYSGLSESSEDMRAAQIIEAREFAREMTQMGGR